MQPAAAGLSASTGTGARGGGYVEIPDGTYQITSFTIPQGVIVRGAGRGATILQSTFAGNVATTEGALALVKAGADAVKLQTYRPDTITLDGGGNIVDALLQVVS